MEKLTPGQADRHPRCTTSQHRCRPWNWIVCKVSITALDIHPPPEAAGPSWYLRAETLEVRDAAAARVGNIVQEAGLCAGGDLGGVLGRDDDGGEGGEESGLELHVGRLFGFVEKEVYCTGEVVLWWWTSAVELMLMRLFPMRGSWL